MPEDALNLFEEIRETPDEFSYRIAFDACTALNNERAFRMAKKLIRQLSAGHKSNQLLVGSVLNMLIKFRRINDAEKFFHSATNKSALGHGMMIRGCRKQLSCNDLGNIAFPSISAFIDDNLFDKALDLLENMPEKPDDFLYGFMINACAASCNEQAIRLGNKLFHQLSDYCKSHLILSGSLSENADEIRSSERCRSCFPIVRTERYHHHWSHDER